MPRASAAWSGPDHSKSVPHSRSLHGTPREAQPAFSHQPAKRKLSPSSAGGSELADSGVSAIGPSAPRERGNARASDGERDTARFRPDSLVIKGFTFSVPARPSLHRIDVLVTARVALFSFFAARGAGGIRCVPRATQKGE